MGGKSKHVQRTKNNTKPSSSGRSAELLATSNIAPNVGFANVTEFGFLPTMLQNFTLNDSSTSIDDMDSTIDTNFQLVFRKMMKKDPITKVKALQEFSGLLADSEVNTIKGILPFWPRLYNNLSTDVEHRVREATQNAQLALVNKAGKSIAPFLKQIAATWITSQYDTYAPAASVACTSFQKAFPSHKLQDVFNFCQIEILDYITKNLTIHTPTTMSSPQSNSPEECEAKYQRVIICSLKGYALYLSRITVEHLQESSNKNTALIENTKFWSYHKHKIPAIRSAWFEALSALLQFAPEFLINVEKQTATSAFQTLDETESIVLPHLWASILLVTQKIPNWQTHINLEKALLPKLWKVLKSGGGGNAETSYPHLLPLLSKLDRTIFNEKILNFYQSFFENISSGLSSRVTHSASSRADISAIATAYFECLQYVIIQLQSFPEELFTANELNLSDICLKYVQTHIIGTIGFLLNSDNIPNAKYVLARVALLFRSWRDNSGDVELYQKLVAVFWTEFYTTVEVAFSTEKKDKQTQSNLDLIFDFVQCLSNKNSSLSSDTCKVKFSEPKVCDEEDVEVQKIAEEEIPEVKSITEKSQDEQLVEFAIKICRLYMKRTSETTNVIFIGHLERLLKFFGSEEFFAKLAGSSSDVLKLYDKFACWLIVPQLRCENTVDIILMLHQYLPESEKSNLLNKLIKTPNGIVQNWILSRILSYPLSVSADVAHLLKQSFVKELLLKVARAIIKGENTTDNINLLHKCFFQNENGNILIDCDLSQSMVDILLQPIADETDDDIVLDTCASFIAQIMPVICSDPEKKCLQIQIFKQLFQLSANRAASSSLSEDTLWEVVTSWQDALSSGDIKADTELIEACTAIVNKNLHLLVNDVDSNSKADAESLAEIVSKFVLCSVEKLDDSEKSTQVEEMLKMLFAESTKIYESSVNEITQASAFIELINGNLNLAPITGENNSLTKSDTNEHLISLLMVTLFSFETTFKMTCVVKNAPKLNESAAETSVDEERTEDFCDLDETLLKKWPNRIYDEIMKGIRVSILSNIFVNNFLITCDLETLTIYLEERVNLFLQKIQTENAKVIKDRIFELIKTSDPFWSMSTLSLLYVEPYRDSSDGLSLLHNDLTLLLKDANFITSYLSVLQCFTPKHSKRQLPISSNLMTDKPDIQYAYRCIGLRCLLKNYFTSDFNEIADHEIVRECLKVVDELYAVSKVDKDFLLYNDNLNSTDAEAVQRTISIIHFLSDMLRIMPKNIGPDGWDFIRIALSSWVLSLSKSSEHWRNPKIAIFTVAVYQLFVSLSEFINDEKIRSSARHLINIIDEWEHVFAKDVNLLLLKCFMKFVQLSDASTEDYRNEHFLRQISACIEAIDYKHVQVAHKIDSKTSIDDLISFSLTNLSHEYHTVRIACATIVKRMTPYLIEKDVEQLIKQSEGIEKNDAVDSQWHFLHKFRKTLDQQIDWPQPYIEEFNFKTTECDDFSEIPQTKSIPFLLLWECILYACEKAHSELRSIYASYIVENKFENLLLTTLFRLMPIELLKNQESKAAGTVYFVPLDWSNIKNDSISSERYACFVYTLALKHLPAVVRKWWTDSHPRQKLLVDKITTAFVSNQLCIDELRSLVEKKEKQDTFQIVVHNSTREVHATYVIDEARMELIIQLPINYPLGTVKVSCGQQIGDKLQSKVVVMQLSIFLTHQNGSIGEVLMLWKRNLDRKFEGVEECYVCYSVIHQETCQLPKLTCKTCKKKFHGQCLYKWFHTSNKSTCPICRNIF